ncbi:hypothetical protein QUF58_12800 [Anaerolineales bacterium HSG24]|nr:hypothetical protein [Anaerolineales bacterium HSG24]
MLITHVQIVTKFRYTRLKIVFLLALTVLACVTNTPVARIPTPQPTRTTFPTFTVTPIPPTRPPHPTVTDTSTPTDTPLPTNTPLPIDTDTPTETSTPTETPAPSSTPVPPTNTPAPPTFTPIPTSTPQIVINSPLPTPVPVDGNTRPGHYIIRNSSGERNCERIAVSGQVKEDSDKTPMQFVEIEVSGDMDDDDDKFDGPYRTKTDVNGNYDIYIGHPNEVKKRTFNAKIVGAEVSSEDIRWRTNRDCNGNGTIQTMRIDWRRR